MKPIWRFYPFYVDKLGENIILFYPLSVLEETVSEETSTIYSIDNFFEYYSGEVLTMYTGEIFNRLKRDLLKNS